MHRTSYKDVLTLFCHNKEEIMDKLLEDISNYVSWFDDPICAKDMLLETIRVTYFEENNILPSKVLGNYKKLFDAGQVRNKEYHSVLNLINEIEGKSNDE